MLGKSSIYYNLHRRGILSTTNQRKHQNYTNTNNQKSPHRQPTATAEPNQQSKQHYQNRALTIKRQFHKKEEEKVLRHKDSK